VAITYPGDGLFFAQWGDEDMDITTHEPSVPDAHSVVSRPWKREPEAPDVEAVRPAVGQEETPTEPGYGHGV
jgi:hypothetical protein